MLYIVDGTGDSDPGQYDNAMWDGFCRRMQAEFRGTYHRGPSLAGTETFELANWAFQGIVKSGRAGKEPIFLAGHSRGGAAVIKAAQLLRERDIAVDAMFLFDAVDRTPLSWNDVQLVPRNVRLCYHARRDPLLIKAMAGLRSAARKRLAGSLVDFGPGYLGRVAGEVRENVAIDELEARLRVAMRSEFRIDIRPGSEDWVDISIDFQNAGVGMESPRHRRELGSRYYEQKFMGTHGAIGGAPIRNKATREPVVPWDGFVVHQVHAWMWSRFVESGMIHNMCLDTRYIPHPGDPMEGPDGRGGMSLDINYKPGAAELTRGSGSW